MTGLAEDGSAEFVGGLFIVLGFLTRPAALVLALAMVVAIFTVHITNGFFMSSNGIGQSVKIIYDRAEGKAGQRTVEIDDKGRFTLSLQPQGGAVIVST